MTTETNEDTVEVEVPGGWSARFRGDRSTFALLLVLCISGVAYGGWVHHKEGHEEHQQVKDLLTELIYVSSITEQKRAELNLTMPDSLRAKTRRRRDEP